MNKQPIAVNFEHRVSGHVELLITRNKGKVEESTESYSFQNLVLDSAFDYWMGSNLNRLMANMQQCKVATQTTAPANTTTALSGTVWNSNQASGETRTNNTTVAPYYATASRLYTFNLGAVVGIIGTVGVHTTAGNALVHLATQIKDSNGTPTTITLTAGDQLTVRYSVRWYPPQTPVTGNITLDGVQHTYTIYAQNLANAFDDAGLMPLSWSVYRVSSVTGFVPPANPTQLFGGTITQELSGLASTLTLAAYTPGSKTRNMTLAYSINEMNLTAGITTIAFSAGGAGGIGYNQGLLVHFSPNIAKTNTKALSLTFNQTMARV